MKSEEMIHNQSKGVHVTLLINQNTNNNGIHVTNHVRTLCLDIFCSHTNYL